MTRWSLAWPVLGLSSILPFLMLGAGPSVANGTSYGQDELVRLLGVAEKALQRARKEADPDRRRHVDQALEEVRWAREGRTRGKVEPSGGKAVTPDTQSMPRRGGFSGFELVMSLLTATYVGGTMLLWWETRSSAKLASRNVEQLRTASIANTLQQIGASDREIRSLLLRDPTIYSPLAPGRSEGERKLAAYFGLVVNHVKHIFLQEQLRQLYPRYWEAVDRDLDASITIPQFLEVWQRVAPYQPEEFQKYMNEKITRVQRGREEGPEGGTRS